MTSTSPRKKEPVNVEIRGQKLAIRSNHDPEFVRRLATYIDDKVGALQQAAPAVPLEKLLMLASMTVAEELFEARETLETAQRDLQKRVDACLEALAEAEADLG